MRIALLTILAAAVLTAAEANLQNLKTVPELDLDRYAGRWFELARLPNKYQDKCAGEVTATYRLQRDGRIEVVNECSTADGDTMSVVGAAKMVEPPSKLKVRFAPAWLSFLPMVWGDYWVIDLAEDYSWAAVGEPSREFFWILSRDPRLPEETIQAIIERAEAQGYDLAPLTRTRQKSAAAVSE